MEIKSRKNDYGHKLIDCPFCDKTCYISRGVKDFLRHMTNQAKNEALEVAVGGMKDDEAKHLQFYKNNTKEKEVTFVAGKRDYLTNSIKII